MTYSCWYGIKRKQTRPNLTCLQADPPGTNARWLVRIDPLVSVFMISGSNEQLQHEFEYTLLNPDFHCWWISKMQSGREDTLEKRYSIKSCFKLGKNAMHWKLDLLHDPETKRQSSQEKHAGSPRPKKARQNKSTNKHLMIPFFDSTGMIYMHRVSTGQKVNKEYYVEVLRELRKRFLRKMPALFK